ncbi:MAG: flagellar hook-associated protein 3, partial [bacterium]
MVTRVTTSMRFSVALQSILRSTSRLQDIQEKIVTGKRILRPSDDPAGMSKALNLRQVLDSSVQFKRNIDNSRAVLNITDATLGNIRGLGQDARTLAVGSIGAP